MSYSNKKHSSRDSGSSFLPPLSPWKQQEDKDTFSNRPPSSKGKTRILSSSIKDEPPITRPKSSKTSPRQAKPNVKLPKIDHKTDDGGTSALEEPEQDSLDKKDELIPRKNPEEFSNMVLPSINGGIENNQNGSDDNVFEDKIEQILDGRRSNNSARSMERTDSRRTHSLSRPNSGSRIKRNESRSSNRSPVVSLTTDRPRSSRKSSVLDDLEINRNNSRTSSPIINIDHRPNSRKLVDSETSDKPKSKINSPLLDNIERGQSPTFDNIVRLASRNGTYILEDEKRPDVMSSRNGTFILETKERAGSRSRSRTSESIMNTESTSPLLERNGSPKSRNTSGRKSRTLDRNSRPNSGKSISGVSIDGGKVSPLLDHITRSQSPNSSLIESTSEHGTKSQMPETTSQNQENISSSDSGKGSPVAGIKSRLDSHRESPILERNSQEDGKKSPSFEDLNRPNSGSNGDNTVIHELQKDGRVSSSNSVRSRVESRINSAKRSPSIDGEISQIVEGTNSLTSDRPDSGNRSPLIESMNRPNSGNRTPIIEGISRPNSGQRTPIIEGISRPNSGQRSPIIEGISRPNSGQRTPIIEGISRPNSGQRTPIIEGINRPNSGQRTPIIEGISRPNSGQRTPIIEGISRPNSGQRTPIIEGINRPNSGQRTPIIEGISRPNSGQRTPIIEGINRPNSGQRTPIIEDISRPDSGQRTPIIEGISRPNSGQRTPIIEGINRPNSGQRTPIIEGISRPDSGQRTPIIEGKSRPNSGNRTPIIEGINRPDSGNRTPIIAGINRPESGNRTPINENINRPDSGQRTPIIEGINRPNSGQRTPIIEGLNRPESGNRTPIIEGINRPESGNRTPIIEGINRPESGNRTPNKESISRPESGNRTPMIESISRPNSGQRTPIKEVKSRPNSGNRTPKSGNLSLSPSRSNSVSLALNTNNRPNSGQQSPIINKSHSRSLSPDNVEASISDVKVSVKDSLERNSENENQTVPVAYGSDEIEMDRSKDRYKSVSEDDGHFSFTTEERTTCRDDVRSSWEFQSESGIGTIDETMISQSELSNIELQNSLRNTQVKPTEYTTENENVLEKETTAASEVQSQQHESISKSPSPTESTLYLEEEENCVHLQTSVVNVAERYTVEVYRTVTSSKPRKRRRTAKVNSYNQKSVAKPATTSSASDGPLTPAIQYSLGTTIVAITEPGVYNRNGKESRQSEVIPVQQSNDHKEITSKESHMYENIQAYTVEKDEKEPQAGAQSYAVGDNDDVDENQIVSRETLICENVKAKCIEDEEEVEPLISSYTSTDSDAEETNKVKHNDDENNKPPVPNTTCLDDEQHDDVMASERLVFEEIVLKGINPEEEKQSAQNDKHLVYSREAKIYNIDKGYGIDQWATEDFIDVVAKQMADIAITRVLNENNFVEAPEPLISATTSEENNRSGSSPTNNDCSERNNDQIRPQSVIEDKNELQRRNEFESNKDDEIVVTSSETLQFVNSVAKTLTPEEENQKEDKLVVYSQESLMYTVDQAHPIEEWAIEDDIDVVAKILADIAITRVLNEGNEEVETGPAVQGYALENDEENIEDEKHRFDEQSQRIVKERETIDKDEEDEDRHTASSHDFVAETSESLKFENIMAHRVTGDEEFDKSIVYSQEIQSTTIDRGHTDEVYATEDFSEIMVRQLVDTALITALNDEEDDEIEPPLFDETAQKVNNKQNTSTQKHLFDESEKIHSDEISDDDLIQTSSETLKYEEIILQTLTAEESSAPAEKGLVYSREVKKYVVDQGDIIEQWATEDFIDVVAKQLVDIALTRVLNENNDAEMVPVQQTCMAENQEVNSQTCSSTNERNARSVSRTESTIHETDNAGEASEKLVYEHIRASGVDDTDNADTRRTPPVPTTSSTTDNNDKSFGNDDLITASENKIYEHIIVDTDQKPVVTKESIVQSREIKPAVVTDKSLVEDLFATEDFIDVMAKILADIALLRAMNSLDDKDEEIQPPGFEDSPATRRNIEKQSNEKHDDTRATNHSSAVQQYAVSRADEAEYEYGIPIKCNQFYLDEDVAFLNHGSFGAVPKDVVAELEGVIKEHETNPDEWERVKWQGYQDESLRCVADFIGADKKDVAFVESTIRGIKRIFAASDIENDDEIIINNWTVKGVRKVVNTVCKIFTSVHCTTLVHDIPIKDPEQILDQYRLVLKHHKKVKLVIVDHISSAPSVLFPIKELVEICHAHGVMIVVNGAHGPGHVPINVKELNADFYVGNLSKWTYAPTGCAFIWTHPTHRAQMVEIKHMFKNDREISKNQFFTAKHALDFYYRIGGMDRITAYNNYLLDNATDMLAKSWGTTIMWVPKSMEAPFMRCVMLPHITYVPRTQAGATQIFKFLWDKYKIWAPVFCIGRRLYVRISAQVYCIPEDYVRLREAVLEMVEMAEEQMAEVYVVNNQLPKKDSDLWSMMSVSLSA